MVKSRNFFALEVAKLVTSQLNVDSERREYDEKT